MEENKKAFDLFSETNNHDIQAEVPKYRASINQPTESVFTSASLSLQPAPVPPVVLDAPNIGLSATDNFYRETIKNPPKNRLTFSMFKKAVAFLLIFTLGTGTLGLGVGAGIGFMRFRGREHAEHVQANNPSIDNPVLTSRTYTFEEVTMNTETGSLADIVELLTPSVVGIISYRGNTVRYGSGVIFDENDEKIFIVTSNYVVSDMERVSVSIAGSAHIDAHPAGADTTIDLSVISIYKSQLLDAGIDTIVLATFGDSDQMRVSETVLAIGNAMGGGNSVTRGVLSSTNKSITMRGGHGLSLFQTDAAINYGNSGGPLINTRGEVIGINLNQMTDRFFSTAVVEGMGYSVPSNILLPLLDDMVHRRRPALGIMGGDISAANAARLGVPTIGVYVDTVIEGHAAYRGGMQRSDIITGFNGLPVLNWQQLVYAIRSSQIGVEVRVNVLRNGTEAVTLYIVLDAMIVENF